MVPEEQRWPNLIDISITMIHIIRNSHAMFLAGIANHKIITMHISNM